MENNFLHSIDKSAKKADGSPKRMVVLGGGESGVGTAVLAQQLGYDVFLSDKSKIAEKYSHILIKKNIAYESEMHTIDKILNADIIMKSPGIPEKHRW